MDFDWFSNPLDYLRAMEVNKGERSPDHPSMTGKKLEWFKKLSDCRRFSIRQ